MPAVPSLRNAGATDGIVKEVGYGAARESEPTENTENNGGVYTLIAFDGLAGSFTA